MARREFFAVAARAAAIAGGAHSAAAALYPDRPIRLVLPFPPGGVFDIVGRPWADKVKASLGPVFVDNQPGAGGSLAAQLVAHAPADGYTIFLGASSIHLTEMILREHPLLDPMKELTPVSVVAITDAQRAQMGSELAQSCLRLTTAGQTQNAALAYFGQGIEDLRRIADKTVTISFWAWAGTGAPRVGVLGAVAGGVAMTFPFGVRVLGRPPVASTIRSN